MRICDSGESWKMFTILKLFLGFVEWFKIEVHIDTK